VGQGDGADDRGEMSTSKEDFPNALALVTAYEVDGAKGCSRVLESSTIDHVNLILALSAIAFAFAQETGSLRGISIEGVLNLRLNLSRPRSRSLRA
jgi:hypothetical protein